MQIKFCGAAKTVTGSSHLITLSDGYNVLLDCGMFQGKQAYIDEMNQSFLFNPADIDVMILSHAHIDHCGRIPKLVKEGFAGIIYCTEATADLVAIMLADSAFIQEKDSEWHNKKRKKKGLPPLEPLYTTKEVPAVIEKLRRVPYEKWVSIKPGLEFLLRDNGHILGSASVHLKITEGEKQTMLGFTGDIGRPNRPILKDPISMEQCDYLISESTYGGRIHTSAPDDANHFLEVINKTCVEQKGKVLIPAFSIGRTQEIVYMLDQMEKKGLLPRVPVYVDSPLSTNATEIYRSHSECFDDEIKKYLTTDDNPFGFNNLHYIREVEDSKKLNNETEACIIIAASGMAEAGRITHHIFNHIENSNNTLMLVGYCGEGTLGARIRNGENPIRIFGEAKKVNAKIEIMDSFSAHGDHNEMLRFLDNQNRNQLQKLFLVHGEPEAQDAFRKGLIENKFTNVVIPNKGETVVIN